MKALRHLLIPGTILAVIAGKWMLLDDRGMEMPYMDVWAAESVVTFEPAANGTLGWYEFWHPHNEHRPVFSKLWALLWLQLNGQWDNLLVATANSVLHLSAFTLLALVARRLPHAPWSSRWRRGVWADEAAGSWNWPPWSLCVRRLIRSANVGPAR